uniref:Chromosome partitioning protein n=1 Tax=Myoviridae sp. ctOyc4 TaxID=2827606 RepID=A0A8S5LQA7_9CAUD|nr:MAG TPA: chromosome partitioning protein [Myoviridae sp. ctOyc4]
MAKKFDLAALMGEAVSKSDTGEMRVEQIPLVEIEENESNSYAQTGIDELAESIEVIGLQQPLVVRRKTEGGYLLLAGHRRRNALALLDRKTAPCIVLDADLDESLQVLILHWTNTMARGGGGLTAEYTGQAAKEIEAALKDLQARGVVELPGKLRSYVAEVLKTSESQIARAKAIDNGLTKAWQGDFKCHRISDSAAYELSQCDADLQRELHGAYKDRYWNLDAKKIKAHRKAAEFDFAPLTCPEEPYPKQPCTGADKRAAAVKRGECPGCCHECEKAESCNNVCGKVKQRLDRERSAAEREEKHKQELAKFNASPLAKARRNIRFALACKDIRNVDDLPEARHQWYMSWLWSTDPLAYHAPDLSDLFEVAQALEIDPFEMIAGQEPSSVWHKYTEERPPEGARVLCKLCGCANRYGEYIYRGGKWYFPDIDDEQCEANILVSAWTEVFPE